MLFPSLFTGAVLHILSQERALDPVALAKYFARYPIDYVKIAPSHLAALLQGREHRQLLPQKCLIIGGEASHLEWVQQVCADLAPGTLYNHYGPTETTVGSLTCQVSSPLPAQSGSLTPIGKPLANTQIYILDQYFQPVPPGVEGELYIGGSSVTRGYLGHPDMTAERFLPHPFGVEAGARLYRTGDRARYRYDGNVEFMGRRDEQVKIRGYRIEPGEIETALLQHPTVQDVVVMATQDVRGDSRLVAYLVGYADTSSVSSDLHKFLRTKLPEYMLPSTFLWLQAFPHTAHGKIDRKALQAMTPLEVESAGEWAAPLDPLEEMIAGIWGQVLGRESVGVHENFFEMGGHSLLAIQLISRLRTVLHMEVPLRTLFEAPSVAALAQQLRQIAPGQQHLAMPPLAPLLLEPRPDEVPLSFAQQRLWFLYQLDPLSFGISYSQLAAFTR